jgi:CheY-like chemotaxis protein
MRQNRTTAQLKTLSRPALPRRVLIVDDDADFGQSLATLLRRDGHDVRFVCDGSEAVAQASCWSPELVLLDIYMPGRSGFATARDLRSGCPGMPMYLVMTSAGCLDEATLLNAGEAGFDRCVDKTNALPAVQEIIARDLPRFARS